MTRNVKTSCPNCGKPLPPGALGGLCPACLLAQGADTDPGGPPDEKGFKPLPLEEVAKLFPSLEILSLLGAGGMGAVYKARQPALDRMVALKILPPKGAAGVNFAERFNAEARALARLNHPSIVGVHEFGQVDGLHFFIMEFVDGANLRQLEKAGRLSPRETLQIIPQICDALQYAHDEGIVHRDIKPENVLVDRKGRVKIADFGLAKILGRDPESTRLTAEGQVMGTPHYMAPEQVERPLSVDHRADIYSLGVVLYEMLTGDLPLGKFSPPSRKVEVDVRFDEIVLRALENDPERRYQHASEIKSGVQTISDTPTPTPAGAGNGQRMVHWADFPVAIERDGKRRVNWKGTCLAFAVIFGLLTIGFAFVSAISGRSLLGWLGIIGWPSVVARLLIAALIVCAGVWRALHQPFTSRGTAILTRKRPWWRSRKVVLPAILLVAASWTLFQEKWLGARIRGMFQTPEIKAFQVATRDPWTGALVGNLPTGERIELLAVSGQTATARGWWVPDGTPFTGETFTVKGWGPPGTNVDFIFRLTEYPVYFEFEHSDGNNYTSREVIQGDQPLDRAWAMRVAFREAAATTTVRMGMGVERWQTIATYSPAGQPGLQTTQARNSLWKIVFQHGPDHPAQAQVTVQGGPEDNKTWQVRVIAVGTNDALHTFASQTTGSVGGRIYSRTFAFPSLSAGEVKEFQMEMRPVHTVEFRDVAMVPLLTAGDETISPSATKLRQEASVQLWAPLVKHGELPDPSAVLNEARQHMQAGKYEEALQRHIWYHNHAVAIQPSQSAVRLSFALADWAELGRRYSKAKRALIEIRNHKVLTIVEGRGYADLFSDVNSINYYLQNETNTVALFKHIHEKDPALARQCAGYARDALVKGREYDVVAAYIPDAQADFDRMIRFWKDDLARAASDKDSEGARRSANQRFVVKVSQLIEILAGAGRQAEAEQIRGKALALIEDGSFANAGLAASLKAAGIKTEK